MQITEKHYIGVWFLWTLGLTGFYRHHEEICKKGRGDSDMSESPLLGVRLSGQFYCPAGFFLVKAITRTATTTAAAMMPMMSPQLVDDAGVAGVVGVVGAAGVAAGAAGAGAGAATVTDATLDGSEWPTPVTASTL